MTNRTCLTCVYWKRHDDEHVGTCEATNAPEVYSYRVQHESCTEGCYQFGEDRPSARITHTDMPMVTACGKEIAHRVCAYYEAPWPAGVKR